MDKIERYIKNLVELITDVKQETKKEILDKLKDIDFQMFVVQNCNGLSGDNAEYCYFDEDEFFKELKKQIEGK